MNTRSGNCYKRYEFMADEDLDEEPQCGKDASTSVPKRRPGRPAGSRNRPKVNVTLNINISRNDSLNKSAEEKDPIVINFGDMISSLTADGVDKNCTVNICEKSINDSLLGENNTSCEKTPKEKKSKIVVNNKSSQARASRAAKRNRMRACYEDVPSDSERDQKSVHSLDKKNERNDNDNNDDSEGSVDIFEDTEKPARKTSETEKKTPDSSKANKTSTPYTIRSWLMKAKNQTSTPISSITDCNDLNSVSEKNTESNLPNAHGNSEGSVDGNVNENSEKEKNDNLLNSSIQNDKSSNGKNSHVLKSRKFTKSRFALRSSKVKKAVVKLKKLTDDELNKLTHKSSAAINQNGCINGESSSEDKDESGSEESLNVNERVSDLNIIGNENVDNLPVGSLPESNLDNCIQKNVEKILDISQTDESLNKSIGISLESQSNLVNISVENAENVKLVENVVRSMLLTPNKNKATRGNVSLGVSKKLPDKLDGKENSPRNIISLGSSTKINMGRSGNGDKGIVSKEQEMSVDKCQIVSRSRELENLKTKEVFEAEKVIDQSRKMLEKQIVEKGGNCLEKIVSEKLLDEFNKKLEMISEVTSTQDNEKNCSSDGLVVEGAGEKTNDVTSTVDNGKNLEETEKLVDKNGSCARNVKRRRKYSGGRNSGESRSDLSDSETDSENDFEKSKGTKTGSGVKKVLGDKSSFKKSRHEPGSKSTNGITEKSSAKINSRSDSDSAEDAEISKSDNEDAESSKSDNEDVESIESDNEDLENLRKDLDAVKNRFLKENKMQGVEKSKNKEFCNGVSGSSSSSDSDGETRNLRNKKFGDLRKNKESQKIEVGREKTCNENSVQKNEVGSKSSSDLSSSESDNEGGVKKKEVSQKTNLNKEPKKPENFSGAKSSNRQPASQKVQTRGSISSDLIGQSSKKTEKVKACGNEADLKNDSDCQQIDSSSDSDSETSSFEPSSSSDSDSENSEGSEYSEGEICKNETSKKTELCSKKVKNKVSCMKENLNQESVGKKNKNCSVKESDSASGLNRDLKSSSRSLHEVERPKASEADTEKIRKEVSPSDLRSNVLDTRQSESDLSDDDPKNKTNPIEEILNRIATAEYREFSDKNSGPRKNLPSRRSKEKANLIISAKSKLSSKCKENLVSTQEKSVQVSSSRASSIYTSSEDLSDDSDSSLNKSFDESLKKTPLIEVIYIQDSPGKINLLGTAKQKPPSTIDSDYSIEKGEVVCKTLGEEVKKEEMTPAKANQVNIPKGSSSNMDTASVQEISRAVANENIKKKNQNNGKKLVAKKDTKANGVLTKSSKKNSRKDKDMEQVIDLEKLQFEILKKEMLTRSAAAKVAHNDEKGNRKEVKEPVEDKDGKSLTKAEELVNTPKEKKTKKSVKKIGIGKSAEDKERKSEDDGEINKSLTREENNSLVKEKEDKKSKEEENELLANDKGSKSPAKDEGIQEPLKKKGTVNPEKLAENEEIKELPVNNIIKLADEKEGEMSPKKNKKAHEEKIKEMSKAEGIEISVKKKKSGSNLEEDIIECASETITQSAEEEQIKKSPKKKKLIESPEKGEITEVKEENDVKSADELDGEENKKSPRKKEIQNVVNEEKLTDSVTENENKVLAEKGKNKASEKEDEIIECAVEVVTKSAEKVEMKKSTKKKKDKKSIQEEEMSKSSDSEEEIKELPVEKKSKKLTEEEEVQKLSKKKIKKSAESKKEKLVAAEDDMEELPKKKKKKNKNPTEDEETEIKEKSSLAEVQTTKTKKIKKAGSSIAELEIDLQPLPSRISENLPSTKPVGKKFEKPLKKSKRKRNEDIPIDEDVPKPKKIATDDFIPLDVNGPTKFGLAPLNKFKNPYSQHTAADFKNRMLYGDRIKRIPSKNITVFKEKQKFSS